MGDGEARLSSCRVQRVKDKMASYLVDKDSCIFWVERAWTALIRLKGEHGSRNSAWRNLKHDSMWAASDFSGGRGCKRGAREPLPVCGTKKTSPSLLVKGLRGWRMNRRDERGVKTKKETAELLEWNHLASSCASVNEAGVLWHRLTREKHHRPLKSRTFPLKISIKMAEAIFTLLVPILFPN